MQAIRYNLTVPRYLIGKMLGKFVPQVFWNGASCTYLDTVPEPKLPGDEWVVVQTRYGGICGSDLGGIHLHSSPYYSPLNSFPFTFGHENVGKIAEAGKQAKEWNIGERVVVEPTLWCQPRGFEDLCRYCAQGENNRCERVTEGELAPGLMTGYCRDTGGSWSRYFLAHRSQLYRLPEEISDENGLLIEPFATGLHAALQAFPPDDATILIIGAGTIGLCTLAGLRALGSQAHILVLARYPFQAEAARRLGASQVISARRGADFYQGFAEATGARLLKPIIGKRVVLGGVDQTYECTGASSSLDDALRFTRNGGKVVLVGDPGIPKGVDWTTIFSKELQVQATYIYNHAEAYGGQRWRTFDLAIELMRTGKVDLSWMLTHTYRLEEYGRALAQVSQNGQSQAIKGAFSFEA